MDKTTSGLFWALLKTILKEYLGKWGVKGFVNFVVILIVVVFGMIGVTRGLTEKVLSAQGFLQGLRGLAYLTLFMVAMVLIVFIVSKISIKNVEQKA